MQALRQPSTLLVVLACGRAAGRGASSATAAGPQRGPILAGIGSEHWTERGPGVRSEAPRVVGSICRCDSGTRIAGSAVRPARRHGIDV